MKDIKEGLHFLGLAVSGDYKPANKALKSLISFAGAAFRGPLA